MQLIPAGLHSCTKTLQKQRKNTHAYVKADKKLDYSMVMMKMRLRLKRPQRTKQRLFWKKEVLKNCEIWENLIKK